MEKCWQRDSRQRPTFDALIQLLQSNIRISADFRGKLRRFAGMLFKFISIRGANKRAAGTDRNTDSHESMRPGNSRAVSIQSSVPPAYEVFSSPPGSAPPTISQFRMASGITLPNRTALEVHLPLPGPQHTYSGSEATGYQDCVDEEDRGPTLKFNEKVGLAPSISIRTSSSGKFCALIMCID